MFKIDPISVIWVNEKITVNLFTGSKILRRWYKYKYSCFQCCKSKIFVFMHKARVRKTVLKKVIKETTCYVCLTKQ